MISATKKKSRKDKLSKKAKKDIIKDVMAERMEDTIRRGFQKALIAHFMKEYGVKVSHNYMSELVKECREDMERVSKPVFAKEQYVKRYSRLLKRCVEAQDRGVEKQTLRDMATLEGHMKETHDHHIIDDKESKELEDFYDSGGKVNGKGKKKGAV